MSKSSNYKTKLTDWIQAIAAAISIPAAIFAFYTFFQNDKDIQQQINSLDTISRQSIKQTEILTKQVELLREEQVFQKNQNDISLAHRQTEIEPKLIIEFDNYSEDIVSANLINIGRYAKILKIEPKKTNDYLIIIPFAYIGEGKEKQISFRLINPDKGIENTVLSFTLFYEDIDKKKLSKDFYFKDIEEIIKKKYENVIL